MKLPLFAVCAGGCAWAAGAVLPGAQALAGSEPGIAVEASVEFQDDWIVSAESGEEFNEFYNSTGLSFAADLSRGFSIQSDVVFEPVIDPVNDWILEDHGLYAETLFAAYTGQSFSVFGGKFAPSFGLAWDLAPGLYGGEFSGDLEIKEQIGFGADVNLGGTVQGLKGQHVLAANVFFADTTILSNSLFQDRGRVSVDDGGLTNTESLQSFSITLDGSDMPTLDGIGYHIGVRRLEGGGTDTEDETGVVGALSKNTTLDSGYDLEGVVEVGQLFNADGADQSRTYFALGARTGKGPWSLSFDYSGRVTQVNEPMEESISDHAASTSIGYAHDSGASVEIGYNFIHDTDENSHILGALFAYEFGWSN